MYSYESAGQVNQFLRSEDGQQMYAALHQASWGCCSNDRGTLVQMGKNDKKENCVAL